MTSAPGAKSYGFDPQGRTTTESTPEGTTTFTYDSLDRLTGRTSEDQPAQSFAYDALGRLTTTTQGGLTRTNNYALSDAPILETTAITGSFSSSSARSLSYGPTGLLESRIGSARPSYPVAALIGEISDLGKAGAARDYDPFGVELTPQEPADDPQLKAGGLRGAVGTFGNHPSQSSPACPQTSISPQQKTQDHDGACFSASQNR